MKSKRRTIFGKSDNAAIAKEDVNVKGRDKQPRPKQAATAKRKKSPGKRLMDFTG